MKNSKKKEEPMTKIKERATTRRVDHDWIGLETINSSHPKKMENGTV